MAACGPYGPAPHLAAGVSGGPHSLALALLARDWVAARGGRLTGLVVDHGLRGESAAEAEATRVRLATLGLPARVLTLTLRPGPALHERARAARLAALLAAAESLGAPWLLLGHHRGDQAETVAMRALRGSGPDGLAGMAPVRAAPGALILRPLLGMAPAALEAVCAKAGVAPLRDPSNADPRFARSRLRAVMDPDGAMAWALSAIAAGHAHHRQRLARAVAVRLAQAVSFRAEGWARVDRAALGRDATAVAALGAAIRTIAGAEHPAPARGVARLIATGHGTLHGAVLTPQGVLAREAAALALPVPARAGAVWDRRWRLDNDVRDASIGPGGGAVWPGRLPAVVRFALPALRQGRNLALLPSGLTFRPAGGPAV